MRNVSFFGVAALLASVACGTTASSDGPDESGDALAMGAERRVAFAPGLYFGSKVQLEIVHAKGASLEAGLRLTKGGRVIEGAIDVALGGPVEFVAFSSHDRCTLQITNDARPALTGTCDGATVDQALTLRPLSVWKGTYVHPSGAVLEIERADSSAVVVSGRSSAGAVIVAGARAWIKAGIQTERLGEGCEMIGLEDDKGETLRVLGIAGVCPFAGALVRQR